MLFAEIAGTRVAIPAAEVRSVILADNLVPVPHAPPHVAGLTTVRSQALTVIDCRVSLGEPAAAAGSERWAAVVARDSHLYALLVDRVDDVRAASTEIRPVPIGYGAAWQRAGRGLLGGEDDRPALVIDAAALIDGPAPPAA